MTNNIQKAFKTKSSLRGMANGGEVFKNTIAGVPTFTDSRAATAGAKAYTPGQSGGTLSVIGQDPGTMAANAAAQKSIDARKAAAAPPPTLESALTSFFSNHSTTQAPATTPATSSSLRARQNTPAPQTQLAQDFNAFFPAAAPAMPHSTAPVSQQVMEDFRTFFPAAADSTSTTDRLAMRSPGRDFHPYMAHGGKVKGPGGPTSDDVGPVMLSDGEYVLPADTVDIVGRDNLDALRLTTHNFVDDSNKPKVSGLRKMANGGVLTQEDLLRPMTSAGGGGALVPPPRPSTAMVLSPRPSTPLPSAGELATRQPQVVYTRPVAEAAAPGAARAGTQSLLSKAGRVLGKAATPVYAAMDAYTDSPEARKRAASGQDGVAGAASQLGSYLGSALLAGTSSPQDIGALISAARGEGTGAYHSVPDNEKGWARALGDKYLPTESASIMAGGVRLPPAMQERADRLTAAGFNPAGGMSEDDFARARALEPEPTAPGGGDSTDVAMGNLRRGEAPGGGFAATNVPGIFGRQGPNNDPTHLGEYVGVGKAAPQEDPIMGEIRSALRGLTDGAGNRGGGGGASIGSGDAREINKRYDAMLRDGSGRNRVRGLDWSQRHGLDLERARASELGELARNQSTLRGQDMSASTAANSANMQARMQALQTLGTMANQRSTLRAQAQDAAAKAANDDRKANEGRSKDAMASMNDAIDRFAAGDKDVAVELANVASRLPKDLRAGIDSLPASDRPGAWASVFAAYGAQSRGFAAGRDAGAMPQNALLGAGVGASMPGIGRGVGFVGDLAGTALTRGRYRGTVLRDLLGSRAGSAVLGAGVGAFATPETQTTGLLNLPMVGEDGLPMQADATFLEGLQHGVYDTNKPWANLQRGEDGKLQSIGYTDDELAAIRDLTSLRRFGRE